MTADDRDEEILFEAAGWMARVSDPEASEDDRRAMKAWLAEDKRHLEAMRMVEAQWQLAGKLAALSAKAAPRRKIAGFALPARLSWSLATAMPIVAAVAVILLIHPFRSVTTYESSIGGNREVALADGSTIRMNTDSALTVTYDLFERHVALRQGEAEFNVAHNAWRPFTVDADRVRVRVTGTHFLVREAAGQVRTYLIEGAVELQDSATARPLARLRPGNRAIVAEDGSLTVDQSDGQQEGAWLSGKLVFNQTSLGDALAEFGRYAPLSVTVASDEVRSIKISGVYRSSDFPGFIETLTKLRPLHVTKIAENRFIIDDNKRRDTK